MAANANGILRVVDAAAGAYVFPTDLRGCALLAKTAGSTVDFGNAVAFPLSTTLWTPLIMDPNLAGREITIATQNAWVLELRGLGK